MCPKAASFCFVFLCAVMFGNAAGTQGQTPTPKLSPKPTPTAAVAPEVKRWFDIDAFSLSTRYRYVRTNNGRTAADQQQWQLQFRPRLKFDRKGRYSISAGLFTGNVINGGWNNAGPGTGRGQTNIYVKQLYFDAKPVKEFEVQFGGLGLNNGENTEITGYDNDAYMTGERVLIRAPKHLYFDEISMTNGFFGDPGKPSVFQRLHRLNRSNYHQFLLRKQFNKHVGFSADYTFEAGRDILHQAVRVKPAKKHFFTTLLFEQYERVSTPTGYGANIFAEKAVTKRLAINGGFARVDRRVLFNADRFPPGKRAYISAAYKLTPELTASTILIEGVGRLAPPATPRTRFEILLTWNVLESLHLHHIF